ncbi:MAG: hypothetical protein LBR98_02355 [Syntrophomonadaceae bacterium]|jgi:hypothetical protein|nr:hypothetical protein [Syntrophomonadaceae bacterium]
MQERKQLWRLALPIVLIVLLSTFVACAKITDPQLYDEYPEKSIENKTVLFNNGCCFYLADFSMWLTNEDGEKRLLLNNDSPPYGKRLSSELPQNISGHLTVYVSFAYDYISAGRVEFPVMDFDSIKALNQDGLLLIFGDGDLSVKAGFTEHYFAYNEAPWAVSHSTLRFSNHISDSTPLFTFEITQTGTQNLADLEAKICQLNVVSGEKPERLT